MKPVNEFFGENENNHPDLADYQTDIEKGCTLIGANSNVRINQFEEEFSITNDFILSTIDFLERKNLRVHLPEFREVELTEGKKNIKIEMCSYLGHADIESNLIFTTTIFFTLLDAYLDVKYPMLEGLSFTAKYRNLPSNNDYDVIIKDIFRVLKIFRNATVHSKSAITRNDDRIIVAYNHNRRLFHLVDIEGIKYILPDEILDNNGEIVIRDIAQWELISNI